MFLIPASQTASSEAQITFIIASWFQLAHTVGALCLDFVHTVGALCRSSPRTEQGNSRYHWLHSDFQCSHRSSRVNYWTVPVRMKRILRQTTNEIKFSLVDRRSSASELLAFPRWRLRISRSGEIEYMQGKVITSQWTALFARRFGIKVDYFTAPRPNQIGPIFRTWMHCTNYVMDLKITSVPWKENNIKSDERAVGGCLMSEIRN